MNIELGYAIYVSLVCTFFGWLQYGMYGFRLVEPIICGPLVGLFLGDIQKGIIIGGTLQLVYMGIQGVGAAIPVNKTTATTIATALSIIAGLDLTAAVTLAVPASVLGQVGRMIAWTINATLMHVADRYAEDAEYKKMNRLTYVGAFVFFVTEFIPVFASVYFGAQFVTQLHENMPVWLNNWLTVSTRMLPALGFGMLFSMMYKINYIPYFLIGFVICTVFGGSLLSIAIIGAAMAMIAFFDSAQQGDRRRRRGA